MSVVPLYCNKKIYFSQLKKFILSGCTNFSKIQYIVISILRSSSTVFVAYIFKQLHNENGKYLKTSLWVKQNKSNLQYVFKKQIKKMLYFYILTHIDCSYEIQNLKNNC